MTVNDGDMGDYQEEGRGGEDGMKKVCLPPSCFLLVSLFREETVIFHEPVGAEYDAYPESDDAHGDSSDEIGDHCFTPVQFNEPSGM